MSLSPHRRTFFPSIPSPSYRSKKSIDFSDHKNSSISPFYTSKSKLRQSSTSFDRTLHNPSKMTKYSLDHSPQKADEKLLSHFLLKYLQRKQVYDNKYLLEQRKRQQVMSSRNYDQVRIDPKFRRVYHRISRRQRKYPQSKFIIGVL